MGFLCIRVYLFILYYGLLSQTIKHLLLNNMHYYCYHVSWCSLVDSSELELLTTSMSVRVCVPEIKTLYVRRNGCLV